jgi:hypothetical protein
MTALPESFDVAKRIGLFVYIANVTNKKCLINDVFFKYVNDLEEIKKGITKYHTDCQSELVRKKFQTGLVSSSGLTSFSKYLRMADGLKILDFQLATGSITPNWNTYLIDILIKNSNHSIYNFALPNSLKLYFTYQIFENDKDLMLPLIQSLYNIHPNISDLNTKKLQMEYAKDLKNTFESRFKLGHISQNDLYTNINRMKFFEKNIRLLEDNLPSTRGLKHMIDPRINWLLDLSIINYERLCHDECLVPLEIWKELDRKENDSEYFYKEYSSYLRTEEKYSMYHDVEQVIEYSINLLKKYYSDLVLVEPVLLLSWILYNTDNASYESVADILRIIEKKHSIMRRKMGGLGFIELK